MESPTLGADLERSGESGWRDRKGNPKVHRAMPLSQSTQ
jgi:hypothetical protein